MKIELLKSQQNIILEPQEDTQYVIIPSGEASIDLILNKQGISAELFALFALKGSENVFLSTRSVHKVPHTTCTINVKGALFDSSVSNYIGKIIIEKPAQQTTSYLEDNILSIGNKTRNASQPILEIEADDVKASHGATVAQFSQEELFYFQTRGIGKEKAAQFLAAGFLKDVIYNV